MPIDREPYSKIALNAALRSLTKEEVRFETKIYTEDTPLEGNVLASGDDAEDKKAEEDVRQQLQRGNMYAWCYVVVSATWSGFCGQASLGCCSYRSEEEVHQAVEDHGLKDEALHCLNTIIAQRLDAISRLLDGSGVGGNDEVPG